MEFQRWFSRQYWSLNSSEWTAVVATAIFLGLLLTTTWTATAAVPIWIAVLYVIHPQAGHDLLTHRPTPTSSWFAACLVIVLYLVGCFWAADIWSALKALALATMAVALFFWLGMIWSRMSASMIDHICRCLITTFVILAFYSLIEESFNHPIKRLFFWPFQAIQLTEAGLEIRWLHEVAVRDHRTNWNMMAISFILWPTIAAVTKMVKPSDTAKLQLLIILLVVISIFQSSHETSKIAISFALAIYLVAKYWRDAAYFFLAGTWALLLLAVIPIALTMFRMELHTQNTLPSSAKHRIVVWKYTVSQIRERPLLGVGLASTRYLDEKRGERVPTAKGTDFQLRTLGHTHNVYLQIWYELGALGSLIFLGFGGSILYHLRYASSRLNEPMILASFACVIVTAFSSFGLHTPWFIANIVALCLLFQAVGQQQTQMEAC